MRRGRKIECLLTDDLVRWISDYLADWGGVVVLGEAQENLCRRARTEELAQFGGATWVIEAQGLPNLIHEFVHALFHGQLADDHGFDYGEIPLDLEHEGHRRILWEELACCGLSTTTCAPLHPDPARFAREWFAEQFEIQGVFHGLERDLDGFRRRVDERLVDPRCRTELEATVAEAHAALSAALGARAPSYVLPDCPILLLWQDYRDLAGWDRS